MMRAKWLPYAAFLLLTTLQVTPLPAAQVAALQKPLPPQPLSDALLTLANEFHVLLIYSTELAEGVTSRGAPAGLSLEDSLHAVLEGTSLTYDLIDGHILSIRSRREDSRGTDDEAADVSGRTSSIPKHSASADSREQVIITGTHILGEPPVGAHPTSLSREYMNERAYATVADAVRALPQNFGGGPSDDTWNVGQEEIYNTSRGMGLNLRGLGAGATLVLLNGRRLAAGGGDGRFVDVSGIPLSAIERIDVFPDGASAIYGADAVGGVVNFELRHDYDGAETQFRLGRSTLGEPSLSQVAQTLGKVWPCGNALVSLEYYQRSELPAADRWQSRDSDLSAFGGDNFDILEGNPGNILSSSGTWGIPRNQNGRGLAMGDFRRGDVNLQNRNEGLDLLPDHRRWSVVGTLNQEVGDRAHLFADLLMSQRNTHLMLGPTRMTLTVPSTNPFYVNPTGGTDPVRVAYSFIRDLGPEVDQAKVTTKSTTLGIDVMTHGWTITPAVSFAAYQDRITAGPFVDQAALARALADSDPDTAFNPFGDGSFTNPSTLEALRLDAVLDRETQLRSWSMTAERSLAFGFDRELRIALGAETRYERLDSLGLPSAVTTADLHASRSVKAGYAEILVPIIDESHGRFGAEHLRLSIASRYEHYSDFGFFGTPRYGFDWSPVQGVDFRGSWSKSFKAPNLVDRNTSRSFSVLTSVPDELGHLSPVLLWFGSNPELQDENATTWTLGADVRIPSQGLTFALTYFDLEYRDRIERLEFSSLILSDPTYAAFVIRNPSPALQEDLCFRGHFLGDINYCLTTPVDAIVDLRPANIALISTSGMDVSIEYEVKSRIGRFAAGLDATYVDNFSKEQYYTSPLQNFVNKTGYPLRFRGKFDLLWEHGAVSITEVLNYMGSYTDPFSSPERFVRSWTTLDSSARYRLGSGGSATLDRITIELNMQNVFDKHPPFVNNALGVAYDPENADLLGRFISVGIQKEW